MDDLERYPRLGQGVYTLAEAAKLTRLGGNRVRHWFKDRADQAGRGPVFASDFAPRHGEYAISFLDLVDVCVVGQLRAFGVSMATVRSAYEALGQQLSTAHPFCHSDLYTDGKKIFLSAADVVGDETLSEIVSQQQFFLSVKERLVQIEYCDRTKLATRWFVANGIVVDPGIAFGKPVVRSTGKSTYIIYQCYRANNKDVELAAELFGLTEDDVHNAVEFEKRLRGHRAA